MGKLQSPAAKHAKNEHAIMQGAANSAGKGLKKGGGYILMGGGILVGSKYGGDTAVKHGAKLADKEVESEQYASYKRAKTGLKIKKGWASLVKGFGKKMEQIGHDIAHSPKVADQSKTYKMASKLEGHGWSMAYDANEMKTKTEERIEKHQELRKAKIQELQNARISPEEKEIQQHFESANEKLGSIEFNDVDSAGEAHLYIGALQGKIHDLAEGGQREVALDFSKKLDVSLSKLQDAEGFVEACDPNLGELGRLEKQINKELRAPELAQFDKMNVAGKFEKIQEKVNQGLDTHELKFMRGCQDLINKLSPGTEKERIQGEFIKVLNEIYAGDNVEASLREAAGEGGKLAEIHSQIITAAFTPQQPSVDEQIETKLAWVKERIQDPFGADFLNLDLCAKLLVRTPAEDQDALQRLKTDFVNLLEEIESSVDIEAALREATKVDGNVDQIQYALQEIY